ncbi:MAG: thiol-disulfide oxidoreductase DCC family protein [Aridibacter famidurans]|nr:thiol-disulfide oxidoreductase DCC family protein [Aridibacter famidurans]
MGATVLFDGVCNFCNSSVNFIIRRDREGYFRFAPLQSDIAADLLADKKFDRENVDSIVLIEDDEVFVYSTAALLIARKLDGNWPLLYAFIYIPAPIRDFFYRQFAKHRYKLFGKKDQCMIPTPAMRARFLSEEREMSNK